MTRQRIFVAGHRGMVGSAIVRQLEQRENVDLILRTRDELNLLDSQAVNEFFATEQIDQVYLAAGKSGRYCGEQYLSRRFHLRKHDD